MKQLRLEREREKAMRETELEMLQREKEAEHFKTWAEQEDNFHLQQAKLRYVCTNNNCISLKSDSTSTVKIKASTTAFVTLYINMLCVQV